MGDDQAAQEVRLFKVDIASGNAYPDLVALLVACYQEPMEFTLSWTDCEEDQIVISSTSELKMAFEEQKEPSTLRLNVAVKKTPTVWGGYANKKPVERLPKRLPNHQNINLKHPGVTCDGCEGPVYGPRFRCTECEDYDLCKPCKRAGKHTGHFSRHKFQKIPYHLRHTVHFIHPLNRSEGFDHAIHNHWDRFAELEVSDPTTDPRAESSDTKTVRAEPSNEPKMEPCETTDCMTDKQLISLEECSVPTFSLPADLETPALSPPCSDAEFVLLDEDQSQADEEEEEGALLIPTPTPTASVPSIPAPTIPALSAVASAPEAAPVPAFQEMRPVPVQEVYPKSLPVTNLVLPSHVYSALLCMIDMGFSNEGDVLAKMLLKKNGDINAVMDLNPR